MSRISPAFELAALDTALPTGSGAVECVVFSSDGRTLAAGSKDGTIRLLDGATGQTLRTLHGHTGIVNSVAFSPDGRTLASGSYDKTVRLWDVPGGQAFSQPAFYAEMHIVEFALAQLEPVDVATLSSYS